MKFVKSALKMFNNKEERCDFPNCLAKHTYTHRLEIINKKNR